MTNSCSQFPNRFVRLGIDQWIFNVLHMHGENSLSSWIRICFDHEGNDPENVAKTWLLSLRRCSLNPSPSCFVNNENIHNTIMQRRKIPLVNTDHPGMNPF